MDFSSHGYDPNKKIVEDYGAIAQAVAGLRAIGRKTVLTVGSWDLLHIGHVRYLNRARSHGDFLIVGVDSDLAIKRYKGSLRPVVPYHERCEMLTYQSCVDLVAPVDDVDEKGKWRYELARVIKPDIFVAVEDSYPPRQIEELKKYCTNVVVLPRQAENTSTSRLIQNAVKQHLDQVYSLMERKQ